MANANAILARLDPVILQRSLPQLKTTPLERGEILAETHEPIPAVYFPQSGIISCVVELRGGGAIETGMIGKDGVFGGGEALDGGTSSNHALIQVAGTALSMSAKATAQFASEHPQFRKLLIEYQTFFLAQVQQTAACNAVHHVQARLCKWLLRMHQLGGPELRLTQEFLAQMLGVQRSTVTLVASEIQKLGMISYSRGRLQIINADRIRSWACECNDDVNAHYERIFASKTPD